MDDCGIALSQIIKWYYESPPPCESYYYIYLAYILYTWDSIHRIYWSLALSLPIRINLTNDMQGIAKNALSDIARFIYFSSCPALSRAKSQSSLPKYSSTFHAYKHPTPISIPKVFQNYSNIGLSAHSSHDYSSRDFHFLSTNLSGRD